MSTIEPQKLMKPQKLAIFLPSLEGGGAERTMLNLAKGITASILIYQIACLVWIWSIKSVGLENKKNIDLAHRKDYYWWVRIHWQFLNSF